MQRPANDATAAAAAAAAASSPDARLAAAAAAGDAAGVAAALAAGADACLPGPDGVTPLMAAAEAGGESAVAALLEAGAPWNAVDDGGYCAGDYAGASGNPAVVELLMDWGVRCEELLAAVQRQQEEEAGGQGGGGGGGEAEAEDGQQRQEGEGGGSGGGYLTQRLVYTEDGTKLLDANGEAVMMGWELPLMVEHAAAVAREGGDVLNVGFGLGLVDEEIQKRNPRSHTIIEAHPDVHARMLELGWDRRPGVKIVFGRWQDVLPALPGGAFDGVFFDTYGDSYDGRGGIGAFHRALPRLVRPGGVYSFFNGFASDNAFFHAVYGRLIQLELQRLGFATEYRRLKLADLGDETWAGVRSVYWKWPWYFLPVSVRQPQPAEDGGGGGGVAVLEGAKQ